jgi:SSS family solute:Na+ symporter
MIDLAVALSILLIMLVCHCKFASKIPPEIRHRDLSVLSIAVALFATTVGGWSTFGFAQYSFQYGAMVFLLPLALLCRDIFENFALMPKFQRFHSCHTVGDVMAHYYGRQGKIAAGAAGMMQCVVMVGLQASAFGFLAQHFLGILHWQGTLVGFLVVIGTWAFSASRPPSLWGILKLAMLIVAVPNFFIEASEQVGGVLGIINSVPAEQMSLLPNPQDAIRIYSLCLILAVSFFSPAMLQRMLASKDVVKIKKAMLVTMIMRAHYCFMIGIIGLATLIMFPTAEPAFALPMLMDHLLPAGLKGAFLVGVVGIILATARSHLDTAMTLSAQDILRPCFRRELNPSQEIKWARIFTLFFSLLSLAGAIYIKDLFELGMWALSFWLPVVMVPLVFAMFGFRPHNVSFWSSGIVGISVMLVWNYRLAETTHIHGLLPALLLCAIIFAVSNTIVAKVPRTRDFALEAG